MVAAASTLLYASQSFFLVYCYQLRGYGPSMAYLCMALACGVFFNRIGRGRRPPWPPS